MLFENQTVNIYDDDIVGIPQIMRTNIQEREGSYLLEIELPGFSREDVLAELTDGRLTIIADRPEQIEENDNKTHFIRRERLIGGCKRSFYVGKDVKQEDITAAFKDGVLSIIIANPKKAVSEEEIKLIPIK